MSEISGIIRNGIERGWPTSEIRTSLINSGYAPQEIDYELNLISNNKISSSLNQQTGQTIPSPQVSQPIPQNKFNPQDLTNYQAPIVEKKASKFVLVILIVLLVLCILAGVGLYLFG